MLIGELEYDDMVENSQSHLVGNLTGSVSRGGKFIAELKNVSIKDEATQLPFPVTDHLFIGIFVFFMTIIMINLLFGLAVSDVQVLNSNKIMVKGQFLNRLRSKSAINSIILLYC